MFTIVFNGKHTRQFTKSSLINKSETIRRICEDEPELEKLSLNGLSLTYAEIQVFYCWCARMTDEPFFFRQINTDALMHCEFAFQLDAYMGSNVIFYYIMKMYKDEFNTILEHNINWIRFPSLFFKLKMDNFPEAENLFNHLHQKYQHKLIEYAIEKKLNVDFSQIKWFGGEIDNVDMRLFYCR